MPLDPASLKLYALVALCLAFIWTLAGATIHLKLNDKELRFTVKSLLRALFRRDKQSPPDQEPPA